MSVHDVVVIGGGVAGVSAALECFDIRLDVVLLETSDRVGGQLFEIPHDVRNVATGPVGTAAVAEALDRNVAMLGDRFRFATQVTEVDLDRGLVMTDGGRMETRSVLVATGSVRRELEDAPDGSFGGDVTYLVEPHREHFAGQPIVVVGGGDSGILDALELAATGSPVTLVHRSHELRSRPDLVARLRSEPGITDLGGWGVDALLGSDRLEAVVLSNVKTKEKRTLEVPRAVLKLGRAPNSALVAGQVDLGQRGGIVVDAEQCTSHPAAFAAGDVVEGVYERIAVAAGQGSTASRSILRALEATG